MPPNASSSSVMSSNSSNSGNNSLQPSVSNVTPITNNESVEQTDEGQAAKVITEDEEEEVTMVSINMATIKTARKTTTTTTTTTTTASENNNKNNSSNTNNNNKNNDSNTNNNTTSSSKRKQEAQQSSGGSQLPQSSARIISTTTTTTQPSSRGERRGDTTGGDKSDSRPPKNRQAASASTIVTRNNHENTKKIAANNPGGNTLAPRLGMLVDRSSFDETESFGIDRQALETSYDADKLNSSQSTVLRNGKVRRRMRWRPKKVKNQPPPPQSTFPHRPSSPTSSVNSTEFSANPYQQQREDDPSLDSDDERDEGQSSSARSASGQPPPQNIRGRDRRGTGGFVIGQYTSSTHIPSSTPNSYSKSRKQTTLTTHKKKKKFSDNASIGDTSRTSQKSVHSFASTKTTKHDNTGTAQKRLSFLNGGNKNYKSSPHGVGSSSSSSSVANPRLPLPRPSYSGATESNLSTITGTEKLVTGESNSTSSNKPENESTTNGNITRETVSGPTTASSTGSASSSQPQQRQQQQQHMSSWRLGALSSVLGRSNSSDKPGQGTNKEIENDTTAKVSEGGESAAHAPNNSNSPTKQQEGDSTAIDSSNTTTNSLNGSIDDDNNTKKATPTATPKNSLAATSNDSSKSNDEKEQPAHFNFRSNGSTTVASTAPPPSPSSSSKSSAPVVQQRRRSSAMTVSSMPASIPTSTSSVSLPLSKPNPLVPSSSSSTTNSRNKTSIPRLPSLSTHDLLSERRVDLRIPSATSIVTSRSTAEHFTSSRSASSISGVPTNNNNNSGHQTIPLKHRAESGATMNTGITTIASNLLKSSSTASAPNAVVFTDIDDLSLRTDDEVETDTDTSDVDEGEETQRGGGGNRLPPKSPTRKPSKQREQGNEDDSSSIIARTWNIIRTTSSGLGGKKGESETVGGENKQTSNDGEKHHRQPHANGGEDEAGELRFSMNDNRTKLASSSSPIDTVAWAQSSESSDDDEDSNIAIQGPPALSPNRKHYSSPPSKVDSAKKSTFLPAKARKRITPSFRSNRRKNKLDNKKQQLKEEQDEQPPISDKSATPQVSVPVDLDDGSFLDAEKNLYAIHEIGIEHLRHMEYTEALEVFEEILRGQLTRYGKDHPRVGTALHNIGLVHMKRGSYSDAARVCREAVRVRKVALGKEHPDLAVSLAQLGVAYLELGRYKKAIINFRQALRIRRRAFGPKHPKVAKILNNIGCGLYELNELKVAKVAFEEALDIQRETLRMMMIDDAISGPALRSPGAESSKDILSEPQDDTPNQVLLSIASTLCNIGSIRLYWGHFHEASVDLEEALLIQQSVLGDDHPLSRRTVESLEWISRTEKELESSSGSATVSTSVESSQIERESSIQRQKELSLCHADSSLLLNCTNRGETNAPPTTTTSSTQNDPEGTNDWNKKKHQDGGDNDGTNTTSAAAEESSISTSLGMICSTSPMLSNVMMNSSSSLAVGTDENSSSSVSGLLDRQIKSAFGAMAQNFNLLKDSIEFPCTPTATTTAAAAAATTKKDGCATATADGTSGTGVSEVLGSSLVNVWKDACTQPTPALSASHTGEI